MSRFRGLSVRRRQRTRNAGWEGKRLFAVCLVLAICGGILAQPAASDRVLNVRCDVSNGFVELAIMRHSKFPRVGAAGRQVLSNRDFSQSTWAGLRDGVYFISGYPRVDSGLATWAASKALYDTGIGPLYPVDVNARAAWKGSRPTLKALAAHGITSRTDGYSLSRACSRH